MSVLNAAIASSNLIKNSKQKVTIRKVIVIDPGHGGRDSGTIYPLDSKNPTVMEKEIARLISNKLEKLLRDSYECYSTRPLDKDSHVPDWDENGLTGHEGSWNNIPQRVKEAKKKSGKANFEQIQSIRDRAAYADKMKADFFISIHTNSAGKNTTIRGMSCIFDNDEQISSSMKNKWRKFRKILKDKLKAKKFEVENKFEGEQTLGVIRNQTYERTAILLETGFISNEKDRNILQSEQHQQEIALAIKEAIDEYFINEK